MFTVVLTIGVLSFQNTTTMNTGLPDVDNNGLTVLKITFPETKLKQVHYRDYKQFI